MAALLDHADSDGLLRDSGAGDSHTMYSNGLLCAFRRNKFSEEQEEMYVETSSAAGAPLRWRSRCVEVTQRAVFPAEEESQRETANDTP